MKKTVFIPAKHEKNFYKILTTLGFTKDGPRSRYWTHPQGATAEAAYTLEIYCDNQFYISILEKESQIRRWLRRPLTSFEENAQKWESIINIASIDAAGMKTQW